MEAHRRRLRPRRVRPARVAPSAPLSCQDPGDFFKGPRPAPTRPSDAYKKERAAEAEAYARDCAKRGGEALRHYHSLNNARDLEVVRAALGERRLTFMGASYGTYLGALYAELFPSHVRRMVFDAVVNPDPEQVWYRNNLDQSEAFEDRWDDFKEWVAEHDAVYGLGDTARQVQDSYEEASARLAAEPAGGTVGPAQFQGAFLTAGYYDDYWPHRAEALSAYLKGDPQPLVDQAGTRTAEGAVRSENSNAVYTAVECNDAPWPADFEVWDRDNTRLARRAPFETWDNVWTNLPCAYWQGPRQRPLDVRTAPGELPPTLVLAAERDAATPYEGALELRRRLAGSVLVTERDAGTHGIAGAERLRQRPPGGVPAGRPPPGAGHVVRPAPGTGATADRGTEGLTRRARRPARRCPCGARCRTGSPRGRGDAPRSRAGGA